jgi:hypothetical protein
MSHYVRDPAVLIAKAYGLLDEFTLKRWPRMTDAQKAAELGKRLEMAGDAEDAVPFKEHARALELWELLPKHSGPPDDNGGAP